MGSLNIYFHKRRKEDQFIQNINKKLATVGVIVVSFCLYILIGFYHLYHPISFAIRAQTRITTVDSPMDIFKTEQMKYTEILLGNRQEPLNFIIVAKDDQQLINLFQKTGWSLSENITIFSIGRMIKAGLLKKFYPQALILPDFWNLKVHNFGFEKETFTHNIFTRHHARFWKTNYLMRSGRRIYVGTVSFDRSLKWGIIHKIDPNIDAEREFLFNDLKKTNMIFKTKKVQFVNPFLGNNFSGHPFFTDGKLYILFVKDNGAEE